MRISTNNPAYGPMVEVCATFGISRTVCFELARKGMLDTFTIGTRRYVMLASLRDLPQRLQDEAKGGAA